MMPHLIAGTDTYGKVKTVKGTPVVTKFAMLQIFPLYPLQSYYFIRTGKTKKGGVPFFLSTQQADVVGIPLARLDKTSVVMTYLRAIFAVPVMAGSLCFLFVIELYSGKELDVVQWVMFKVMLTMLIVGVVGGTLTYAAPVMSRREKLIRTFCAELLGMGVDPALVTPEEAQWINLRAGNASLPDTNQLLTRDECLRGLVSIRAAIAQGLDAGHLKAKTDELLERLNHGSNQ